MDTNLYRETVKDATKEKYGQKQMLKSRYVPLQPDSAERDMMRLSNSYMIMVSKELKEVLPDIMQVYRMETTRTDSRMDGLFNLRTAMTNKLGAALDNILKKNGEFGMEDKLDNIAKKVKRTSVREWRQTVKKTLDLDVSEDYYKDELYQAEMNDWTSKSATSIFEVPRKLIDKIKKIIQKGYDTGKPTTEVQKEIQEAYSQTKRSTAKSWSESVVYLNAQINKKTQEDAGVRRYMWYTRRDARVRPCHKALDGQTCWWNDPPQMWTGSNYARIYTGRRCHPGEDYNCRCSAVPIFEKEHFAPPINPKQEENENGYRTGNGEKANPVFAWVGKVGRNRRR